MLDGALVPAFAPGCRAHVISGARVLVLWGGDRQLLLSGRPYALVAPLIDGRTADAAIVAALARELSAPVVQLALLRMQERGVVVMRPPGAAPSSGADGGADVPAPAGPGELRGGGVGVPRALVARLADTGPVASARGLTVLVVDDYLRDELDALAARCIAADAALLPIRAAGAEWWIGPYLDGAAGAPMWRLFRARLRANRASDVEALRLGATFPLRGEPAVPDAAVFERAVAHAAELIERTLRGTAPASIRDGVLAVDHGSRDVVRRRDGGDGDSDGVQLDGDRVQLDGGDSGSDRDSNRNDNDRNDRNDRNDGKHPAVAFGAWHRIAVVPAEGADRPVPAFGDSLPPLRLAPDRRARVADSGRRVSAPAETLARMAPLISPMTGIVGGLERVPAAAGTYVYATSGTLDWGDDSSAGERSGPDAGADAASARPLFRKGALGKGLTDAQARASAMGEAIELVSARFTGDEPRRRARWSEVAQIAIHPRELLLVSEAQYVAAAPQPPASASASASATAPTTAAAPARTDALDGTASPRPTIAWDGVPAPLDEEHAIEWVPLVSLVDGATRWLAAAYCYLDHDDPRYPAMPFAIANANGCAAGGTLAEAILQGLLELIERDACALWWYSRARRPAIDLDSVGDARLRAIRDGHAAAGRALTLLDLTADTGVAVVAAVASDAADGTPLATGRGCHLDPAIAISRAITELSQGLAIASPDDPPAPPGRGPAVHYRSTAVDVRSSAGAALAGAHLRPSPAAPRRLADLPDLRRDDATEEVGWCVEMLRRLGHDVLVLDTTRAELGFAAVRVVVPGLRPLLPRLAPGRLYDVPPQLGWIPRALSEDELNPHAFVS